jgi:hypothetical protein
MTATLTATRTAPAASPSTRLSLLRASLEAAGWSARVVKLTADERAERINDYGTEGI